MKKDQVKVGAVYSAKVTDKVVPIRIDKENPRGGWDATNLQTNRKVRIKSAQKLRSRIKAPGAVKDGKPDAPADAAKPKRAKKKLTAAQRKALQAKHKADQENARARDERARAKDGMTASERAMAQSEGKGSKKTGKDGAKKKQKRLSLIDAAVRVLAKAGEPMNCKAIVEQVTTRNLWAPRKGGKTPHATLYSAILREIQKKGKDARFSKVDRGQFELTTVGKKGA